MKKIFLFAALASVLMFTACENETPFDTQTPDDAPLILKPYNESGTGSFNYSLANPDTPLFDSVTVTPSAHTTVNWYLDGQLVYTGTKIELCFPAGKYALIIEAVTTAGKKTQRTGSVTVNPYPTDPYSAAPAGGRHLVPEMEMTVDGANLDLVASIKMTKDLYGKDVVCTVEPTAKTAMQLKFTLPDMQEGNYYMRYVDAEGKMYGSETVGVHKGSLVLAGFSEFTPAKEWTMTGVQLDNVASVKVGDNVITDLTVTSTSVTLTAPDVAEGTYTLSMLNKDGSNVMFSTDAGTVTEVEARTSFETTLWEGPAAIIWKDSIVKITKEALADVPLNATISIYWQKLPDGDEHFFDYEKGEMNVYYKMQIISAWWTNIIDGFDVTDDTPNPYTFSYSETAKGLVDEQGSMSVVGWGLQINKVTYK